MFKKTAITFAIVGMLIVTFACLLPSTASAWTTSHLSVVNVGGDLIYNYDFETTSASSSNVDWPVTMMFTGNADINKVKNLYWGQTALGFNMYGRLSDGAGWVWDNDRGTKSLGSYCTCHMRLYADSDDRMYNLTWGYFVIGTSHYDYREAFTDQFFGYSEYAATELSNHAVGHSGVWFVEWNSINMYNYEPGRWEYSGGTPRHYWQNDGYTTQVQLY